MPGGEHQLLPEDAVDIQAQGRVPPDAGGGVGDAVTQYKGVRGPRQGGKLQGIPSFGSVVIRTTDAPPSSLFRLSSASTVINGTIAP